MSVSGEIQLDFAREARIGLPEAIFCEGKSVEQIDAILQTATERNVGLLLTRLSTKTCVELSPGHRANIDFCHVSRTGIFGAMPPLLGRNRVAVVCAGTSDVPVAREAVRTLRFGGEGAVEIADVGVAGLWRLMDRIDDIRACQAVIVVAGMDAALASVIGGLFGGPLIGVPTSVGYGVAEGGQTALNAMLASCAPGLVVCNIDNGYGAACAALRFRSLDRRSAAHRDASTAVDQQCGPA